MSDIPNPPRADNLTAALQLGTSGFAVFPLRPDTGTPYANADVAAVLGIPEPPQGQGGCYLARTDEQSVRAIWARFPAAAIGIATGKASGLFVLDIDTKNGKDGFAAMQAKGWEPPATRWCNTRSGGRHYYYSIPRDGDCWWPSDGELGAGIDRKGDGGYVRWYGDAHGCSGAVPMAAPPDWMLAGGGHGGQNRQPLGSMPAPSATLAQEALFSIDPNQLDYGEWRNLTAAFRQSASALADDATVRLIWDAWCAQYDRNSTADNDKLWRSLDGGTVVGWSYLLGKAAPEVRAKATFGSQPQPVADGGGAAVVPVATPQPVDFWATFNADDTAKSSAVVCTRTLAESGIPIEWDEFADRLMITAPVPWRDAATIYPVEWNDNDTHGCKALLEMSFIKPSKETVFDSVRYIAGRNKRHPVRDYLNSLIWDGTERLPLFLPQYFGAPDNEYSRIIGTKFMIAAVARIMEPGCKVDTIINFEGLQGTHKSSGLRALMPNKNWFTDQLPDLKSKDASIQLLGKWLIECGELDAMSRAEVRTIKTYASRQTDTYRPPYGRATIDVPRQCVFAGTTNEETYLEDQTGNRRWWPVRCGTVDIAAIKRDREQLWAEALYRYRAGETWWLDDAAEKLAKEEQEARRVVDPWEEIVSNKLAKLENVTPDYVCEHVLGIPFERYNRAVNSRIANALRHAGFERKQVRDDNGKRQWCYYKAR